jgi:hypothetical protein
MNKLATLCIERSQLSKKDNRRKRITVENSKGVVVGQRLMGIGIANKREVC